MTTKIDPKDKDALKKELASKLVLTVSKDDQTVAEGTSTAFADYLKSRDLTAQYDEAMGARDLFFQAATEVSAEATLELAKKTPAVATAETEVSWPLTGRDEFVVMAQPQKTIPKPGATDGTKMVVYGSVSTKLSTHGARADVGGIGKFRAEYKEACKAALSS